MSDRRHPRRTVTRSTAVFTAASVLALSVALVGATTAAATVAPRCLAAPPVLSIGSGGYDSYSLDPNGSIWAWGENGIGEVGNGGVPAELPVPVNASGLSSIQALAAGFEFVLALRQDGTVWAWGNDQYGTLGDGRSGTAVNASAPQQVPGLSDVVALSAGQQDGFAFKRDGTVWGWGRNWHGELGDGTTTMRTVPEQLPALTGFTALSVRSAHTVGLKADGTVWAWGFNQFGQIGNGVPIGADQLSPRAVPSAPSGITGVAAGTNFSLALTSSGQVWGWGYNADGELGNGNFNNTSTPTQTSGVAGAVQIAAGDYFGLALLSNGTASSWGNNGYGELGNGSTASPQGTAGSVVGTGGGLTLTAGDTGGMFSRSDGAVLDWGDNDYGEVGNGTVTPGTAVRSPYQVSVVQAPPTVPRNLNAVAGNGVAYLNWTAPTSAITQYVVTPYLNGVAQAQVAAAVTKPPLGAPPGTTSDYTVSGLTPGGDYTFAVAAQNCLGTGPATAQSSQVIPTGPQLGDQSSKEETSRLTDRMSLHVNAFNGNLAISEHDIGIRGTGLDLSLDRTYNSLSTATSGFGHGWSSSLTTSLSVLTDGSLLFNGPAGAQIGFAKKSDGTYASASGADAALLKNTDGSYTLKENSGDIWNFTSAGALTSHADRDGNVISFAHGGPGGAVSAITDTQGRTTTVAYNASNLIASITDPASRLYQYGYDANKNLTTYTDPATIPTRFAYDATGKMTQITTPAGRVVTVAYDGSQRVRTVSHPNQTGNPTTTFTYSPSSCTAPCTSVSDANGSVTVYTFDSVGRAVQVNDGLGNKTVDTYTSNSNVATYSTGNGTAGGTLGYDGLNNLNSAQVAPGSHATVGYTDPSNPFSPTTITDPQNNTTTVSYDAKGNPLTETDALPSQNQVQVTYNTNGTMATSKDPDGHLTSYGYDAKGNLTSITPPAPLGGRAIVIDSVGRPTKLTDGKGQATSYAYDKLDRVTAVTFSNGSTVTNVYDADGNATSMTDATGQTTMIYDAMGRMTRRTTPDGKSVSYTYDGVGNMLTLADAGGTTSYQYNAANLPVKVTDPGNAVTNLGYDANYNRTTVAYPNGATQVMTYDSANRVVSSRINSPGGAWYGTPNTYGYAPSNPTHASGRDITQRGTPSTYGSNGTPTSAVTLETPVGVVAGDVEIAQISTTGDAAVTAVPAGWTAVRTDSTGTSANSLLQGVYSHVAGASEPPVNSWGLSKATYANGGLSAWTGVDPNSPVETSAGQVNAAGSTAWTAPSVAFKNAELDLALYGGRLLGGTSGLSVPVSYTEAYDTQTNVISVGADTRKMGVFPGNTGAQTITGPNASWVGQQVLLRPIYDTSVQQSSTVEGTLTYDAVNRLTSTSLNAYQYAYDGASNRTYEQYALNQGMNYSYNGANELTKLTKPVVLRGTKTATAGTTSTSLALAKPAGTQAGDVLFAQVDISGGAALTAPAGWTLVDSTANGVREALYWHLAGASEPASYSWTFLVGNSASGGVAAYGGVDTAAPIDTWKVGTGSGTSMTAPALTTTAPNDQIIATYAPTAATTASTPTNMTKEWAATSTGTTSAMFDQSKGMATGTGTRSSNAGVSSTWVAHLVALRPGTTNSYDANGSWTGSSDGGSATYDVADRATSTTPPGGTAMSFVYRGMGQSERASMSPALRTKGQCTQISGCTVKTKSEGTTATFENTLVGVSAESDDAATTYYVRDPRGGLLSERTPSGTYYYGFDGRGSVTDIIDSGGGDDAQYVYDPFGQITAMAQGLSVGTDNPWRYVGAYQDGTGLYHMGARYYDPNTGRFTQQDPITNPLDPKQWNRYTYVGGDPINFRDPSGMHGCGGGGLSLGGILHAGYSAVLIVGGGFVETVGEAFAAATCPETLGAGCLLGAGVFFGGHWVVDQGIEASREC